MEAIAKRIDQHLIASHPVYQYMEVGYGLNMISKHWEPDELPTTDQWNDLKKTINENQAQIMIWEDDPVTDIKSKLLEIKVSFAVFNPCANTPEDGDFMSTMNENLRQLEQMIAME